MTLFLLPLISESRLHKAQDSLMEILRTKVDAHFGMTNVCLVS